MDSDLVLHLHEKLYRKSSENTSGTTLSYGENHTGDVSASASRLVDIKCENDSYARTALPSDKLSRRSFDLYVCFAPTLQTHNETERYDFTQQGSETMHDLTLCCLVSHSLWSHRRTSLQNV